MTRHRILTALALAAAALFPRPRPAAAQDEPDPDAEQPAEVEHKVTKAPALIHFVEAEYPPDKKAANVTASVVLSIEIDATGKVGAVEVVEHAPTPDFDAAAVAAAKQF